MCRHFFVLSFSFTFVARNLKGGGWLGGGVKSGCCCRVLFCLEECSVLTKMTLGPGGIFWGFHVGFVKYSIVGKREYLWEIRKE